MLQALTILGAISNDYYYMHFNRNTTLPLIGFQHRSKSTAKVESDNKSTINRQHKKQKVHKMHTLAGGAGVAGGGGTEKEPNRILKREGVTWYLCHYVLTTVLYSENNKYYLMIRMPIQ